MTLCISSSASLSTSSCLFIFRFNKSLCYAPLSVLFNTRWPPVYLPLQRTSVLRPRKTDKQISIKLHGWIYEDKCIFFFFLLALLFLLIYLCLDFEYKAFYEFFVCVKVCVNVYMLKH